MGEKVKSININGMIHIVLCLVYISMSVTIDCEEKMNKYIKDVSKFVELNTTKHELDIEIPESDSRIGWKLVDLWESKGFKVDYVKLRTILADEDGYCRDKIIRISLAW
jgi:hypothetical protein